MLKAEFNLIKKKIVFLILIILLLILSSFYYLNLWIAPIDEEQIREQEVEIRAGMSSNQIARALAEAELIKEPLLFRFLVQLKGVDNSLQSGYYNFNTAMSLNQIIDSLVQGQVIKETLTIPEGFTLEKIAHRVARERGLSSEEFLLAAEKLSQDFVFLEELDLSQRKYPLEGYLFPETYLFSRGLSSQQLIREMLKEFKNKLETELLLEIEKSDYELDEIVTIASLIEGEAKYAQERELISGVIYNRLERGMLLQLDATIQYILPGHRDRILYSDLEVDSLYNTYRYPGLPPGPINSPSLASIKAALNPAETDYLYYFALADGSHKFTETYEEHLRLQNELRY